MIAGSAASRRGSPHAGANQCHNPTPGFPMSNIYSQLTENDLNAAPKKSPAPASRNSAGALGVKFAIALSFILSLAALAGSGLLYQNLNSESRQRRALEASQVQFEEKASSFEELADQYKEEIEHMRSQLKTFAEDRKSFQEKLQKSSDEIAELQAKIENLEAPAEEAGAPELDFADGANAAAASGVGGVAAAAAEDTAEAADNEAPIEAPVVASSAKVMTVNRKFNFVVVNLGIKDNLKMGDELALEREGKLIGKAKVEKLYDTFAAATITDEAKENPIQEGDVVRR